MPDVAWTLAFLAAQVTFIFTIMWLASRYPDKWPWSPKEE